MAKTRAFKSGNSQAVRLPADIAYDDMNMELEVTRTGDVITIFPARGSLKEAVEILRNMPRPDTPNPPIERTQTRKTDWD